ncbi:molybdenum cofactor guanylyltransferase MobA [soil metagenome]
MRPDDRADITGVVLCGGRGSRMGGIDKGLIDHRGRTLVEHAIERLAPQVGTIVLNANRHLDRYRQFGYAVVSDANQDFDGPLAGISTALHACKTDWLMSVPCDVPDFPIDIVDRLVSGLDRPAIARMAVASSADRLHPVFALMHRSVLPSLDAYLARGERRASGWLDASLVQVVDLGLDADALHNLNTPEDLKPR